MLRACLHGTGCVCSTAPRPLTPEQEAAVESKCGAIRAHHHPVFQPPKHGASDPFKACVCEILRDLVARVTEPWSHHTAGNEWPKCKLCRNDLKDILAENKRLDAALERISTLEGLLREAVACVERVERRDMGGQEWLDARRLRLRIEAELAGEGERHGE
jgi:hypothetical protein